MACCNIEEVAFCKDQCEPYIIHSENSYHLIVESSFMYTCENLSDALIDIMCYYYVLNMQYPRSMHTLCLFLQHFVLGLKDNARLPTSILTLSSNLQ